MKTFLISLLLFVFFAPDSLYSQSFAPPGAVWRYLFKPFPNEPPEEVIEVRAKQDTVIQGKTCRWLELTQKPVDLHTQPGIAVYEESSQVFFVEDTSFYLLYDFALNEGDAYTSRLPVAFDSSNQIAAVQVVTALISVDSVKTITVDGQMKKLQYTSSEIYGFGGMVLEGIGGLNWLFPRFGYGPADYSEIFGIICYKDDQIGYGDTISCLVSVAVDELRQLLDAKPQVRCSPNPARGYVTFDWGEIMAFSEKRLHLRNALGQPVMNLVVGGGNQSFTLPVGNLQQGIYFWALLAADGKPLGTGKVIKQ